MTTHADGPADTSTGAYQMAYRRSLDDPEGFWGDAAAGIDWITPPQRVLDDDTPPFYRWFAGGVLNTCFNALDRHVIGGGAGPPAPVPAPPAPRPGRPDTHPGARPPPAP